jgi:PAS domain S-box-containing protein
MTTSSTTLGILVVAPDLEDVPSVSGLLGFEDGVAAVSVVRLPAEIREHLGAEWVDCILCTGSRGRCLDVLSVVAGTGSDRPVVAFVDERDPDAVRELLDAGATDVVRSALPDTPPALVRRRVEGAVDGEAGQESIVDGDGSSGSDCPGDGDGHGDGEPSVEQDLRLYEGILDATPDSAAVYDEYGRFAVVNDQVAALYESTPEDLQGERSPLLDVLAARTDGPDPFEDIVAGRRDVFRTELEMDYPGREGRVTDLRLSRLADGDEFVGVVALGRDVTERRAREQQIERKRDQLAWIDRLNAVIRDVDQGLVGADSREEIETVACRRLAEAGQYAYVVAFRAETADRLVPTAWAGVDRTYLDDAFPAGGLTAETSPGLRAIETGGFVRRSAGAPSRRRYSTAGRFPSR